ncbi:phenazine biosynthesis protein PhzF [Pseudomonas sp. G11-1]|uniref:PhzF family phenazine biosynthesis protein n=1 Tax=Halopseudomonas bauzanensis TaxID=653930 RepID=A0A4U0YEP9_9GAMM|nr:PhzF family phenazine biosynthesis protein [Halopseudomonas bauzanensis]MCO5785987.1 phenazine biosynthesis protein PhzF [Pseudomonas sp. G11-1]MCO5789213.1 phenazine biosynthesis protein PhzF [Pseudomonas sp. G11-2]TKA90322.1 PhzF family phenazine biosynthesis protein [Halopseudomonas bauzanensis]
MKRCFQQIDVFGAKPFLGNPLAVVLDAEGLSTEEMQRITRWMNLSETAFILPPRDASADYRVRIFTLTHELPFAGHPTLGSCHAWLSSGIQPKQQDLIVQECGAGLVSIKRAAEGLAFAAPPLLRSGQVDAAYTEQLAAVLGIDRSQIVDTAWADNGPGWVGVLLEDAATVLAIEADFSRYSGSESLDIGLVGPYPQGSECAFEVRALFRNQQGAMVEDPVTGSLNASLAEWLIATGRATAPYLVSQGTRLGCEGRLSIQQSADDTVWVGGATVTCVAGEIQI